MLSGVLFFKCVLIRSNIQMNITAYTCGGVLVLSQGYLSRILLITFARKLNENYISASIKILENY